MASKYEYYDTNDDNQNYFAGEVWRGQTFKTTGAYKITSVKLKLFKVGTPGQTIVSIRATSGGLPTGEDLCSGTYDSTTLGASPGAFVEITLGAGANLNAATQYAIVVRSPTSPDSSNCPKWRMDYADASYADGKALQSSNSGADWAVYEDGTDMMFQNWGEAIAPPPHKPAAFFKVI